jgi:hypothetical protein
MKRSRVRRGVKSIQLSPVARTHEGGVMEDHALDHAVEFFSKAGSLFVNSGTFYGGEEKALSLFKKAWIVEPQTAMKLLMWVRDCRGGAGNRSGARDCAHWLAEHAPEWVAANIGWFPLVGRWDDLRAFFGTKAEKEAIQLWSEALRKNDVLAAKWADRSDKPLRFAMNMKIGDFRRYLAKLRKDHIVEHIMCNDDWEKIVYDHVPSVAMARYTKAFGKKDAERFQAYKEALKKGVAKIHADVLFPHDCVHTFKAGDQDIAEAQFWALPNFMEGTNEKIIVLCDTSGSMGVPIAAKSSIQRMDVSQGLALYCSSRIPKDNPFHKKFIGFESESEFKNWEKMSFKQAMRNREIFDGACGGTRIDTALDLLLKTAQFYKLGDQHMPTMLLIISDMQFHPGPDGYYGMCGSVTKTPEIEKSMRRWDVAGYKRPKIVYWNLAGYAGQPDTALSKNVAFVSGFSPSVLKAVLSGEDFSPRAVMMRALEKYNVVVPE